MFVLAIALLITGLLFVNVKIKIRFNYAERFFFVDLTFGGIRIKRDRKSKIKIKIYFEVIKHIIRHIKTEYLRLNILIGAEEPIVTVYATQIFRNIFTVVYAIISHSIKHDSEVYVKIMPAFAQNKFSADFDCIISIRVVHIIRAYAKHYFNRIKKMIRRKSL